MAYPVVQYQDGKQGFPKLKDTTLKPTLTLLPNNKILEIKPYEVARNMYEQSELDYLIYNDSMGYADLILNGATETYLKTVTEYKPLD